MPERVIEDRASCRNPPDRTRRFVGTAAWSVPRSASDERGLAGSGLARYAAFFPGVEINSTFYRPHQAGTYARWAESVPEGFRFAVKLRRTITHERRLRGVREETASFLAEIAPLGPKLGPLLVQLPPSLSFADDVATAFFADLRQAWSSGLACEARHVTWFTDEAEELLRRMGIARVAADPPVPGQRLVPGGDNALAYWRLHGSPKVYYSSYAERIDALAAAIGRSGTRECWAILDNTASGAAFHDALALQQALLSPAPPESPPPARP